MAPSTGAPDQNLADWLSDVGATDLTASLVWPPPGLAARGTTEGTRARRSSSAAPPPLLALKRRIQHEIVTVDDQTRQLLEQNWSQFQEQVADGKELLARIEEEDQELKGLENELDGQGAFLPSLLEQLSSHSTLAQAHSLNLYTIKLLTALVDLHASIAALSSLVSSGQLPAAVPSLRDLRAHIARGVEPWIEHAEAYTVLRRWSIDEQVRLEGAIAGALEACFEFGGEPGTTSTLTLRNAISAAPQGEYLPVDELWSAIREVYTMSYAGEATKKTIDSHLARIAKQVLKYIVVPYVEANGRGAKKLELVYSDIAEVDGAVTITLQPVVEIEVESSDENPLVGLGAFLAFFGQHASLLPPSPYASKFTNHLTPVLQSLIINSHLAPSLPSTSQQLEPYLTTLNAAREFESTFLVRNGYFSFLPPAAGPDVEERSVIQEWVARVDRHWAKHVGDRALVQVRQAIVSDDQEWKGRLVDVQVEIEGVPLPPGEEGSTRNVRMQTERHLVSERCDEILRVAREVLQEAVVVGSISFPHPTIAPASLLLLNSFIAILSLFRATAPVHHSDRLFSSSSLSIQFSNDLEYISTRLERTWQDSSSSFTSNDLSRHVERAIGLTRKMGQDWQERQVGQQRDGLMKALDEANGFMYTGDDQRYRQCEIALEKVQNTLQGLAKEWKPVMNPTLLYTTLGTLVNDVLLRVLDEIEGQMDISEEESIRLNKLCKMLHGLEELFEGEVTSVGREVPVWFKFVFLSELLEASMADILFLFDNGHLVDFEPAAIAKLVRALFSDSPLRNRNLEHILKGHPTNVPDDDTTDDGFSRPSTPPSTSARSRGVFSTSSPARRGSVVPQQQREPSPPPAPAPVVKSGKLALGAARISNATPIAPPSPPPKEPTPPPPPAPAQKKESMHEAQQVEESAPVIDPGLEAGFDMSAETSADDPWGLLNDHEPTMTMDEPPIFEEKKAVEHTPPAPEGVEPSRGPVVSRLGAKKVLAQSPVIAPRPPVVVSPPQKPKVTLVPAAPLRSVVVSPPPPAKANIVSPPPPKTSVVSPPPPPRAASVVSPPPPTRSSVASPTPASTAAIPPPPKASSAFTAARSPQGGSPSPRIAPPSPRARTTVISPIQSPQQSSPQRNSPARGLVSPPLIASAASPFRGVVSPPPPPLRSAVVSPPPPPTSRNFVSPPPPATYRGISPSSAQAWSPVSPSTRSVGVVSPPPPRATWGSPSLRGLASPPMRSVISPSPPPPPPPRSSGVLSPQNDSSARFALPSSPSLPRVEVTNAPTTTRTSSLLPPEFTSLGRPRTGSFSSSNGMSGDEEGVGDRSQSSRRGSIA